MRRQRDGTPVPMFRETKTVWQMFIDGDITDSDVDNYGRYTGQLATATESTLSRNTFRNVLRRNTNSQLVSNRYIPTPRDASSDASGPNLATFTADDTEASVRSTVTNSISSAHTIESARNVNTCCICLQNVKDVVLFPCKHLCICWHCQKRVSTCPLCRKRITERVRVFVS